MTGFVVQGHMILMHFNASLLNRNTFYEIYDL